VEGVIGSLADGLSALQAQGVEARRIILVGGGAQSEAVQQVAASAFGLPVFVPRPGEYVADGAARQAAGVLTGQLPEWPLDGLTVNRGDSAGVAPFLERYRHYATKAAIG